jgi:CRP/FNR family transcriptional regulator, cyclic AMP receptor protein
MVSTSQTRPAGVPFRVPAAGIGPLSSDDWHERSFLGQLEPAGRTLLLELGVDRSFEPDETLLHEGDRTRQVYVLLTGRVRVTAENEDGKIALLAIRTYGELVGELACLDGEPRSATVTAAREQVRVKVISHADFRAFVRTHPDVGMAVSRSVGSKLRWATRRRIDFNEPVPRRLARVLHELAEQYGNQNEGRVTLEPYTQPDLAALVGAAQPTTQKALAGLRRAGLIDTGYRSVTIRDMVKLSSFAGLATGSRGCF